MTTYSYSPESAYCHKQPGTLTLVVCLGLAAAFGLAALFLLKQLWIATIGVLLVGWLFSSLTVEIAEGELRWKFGPGLIRLRAPLAEIASAEPVKTGFWDGWGIHITRFGWLYNVSGCDAVALRLRNGKRFALGTDEPQILAARLDEAIRGARFV